MYARPNERGFDYFYGIMEHLTGHYHYITESKNIYEYNDGASSPAFANVTNKVPDTAYDTDLFGARQAVDRGPPCQIGQPALLPVPGSPLRTVPWRCPRAPIPQTGPQGRLAVGGRE
ncbi:MAG: hypothetical protein ACLT8E_02670 [Akkermansia sp.]